MTVMLKTTKGAATRELILDHAYAIACRKGVEGLSIGDLAQAVGMSKSGVFAHFGSREELQLAVLDAGGERFGERVLIPALHAPRGLARLRTIISGWFDWVHDNAQGCLIIGAVSEYDFAAGPLARPCGQAHQTLARPTRRHKAVHFGSSRPANCAPIPTPVSWPSRFLGIAALVLHQDMRLFDPKQAVKQAERAVERLFAANSP